MLRGHGRNVQRRIVVSGRHVQLHDGNDGVYLVVRRPADVGDELRFVRPRVRDGRDVHARCVHGDTVSDDG
jgi:hypothetical protein